MYIITTGPASSKQVISRALQCRVRIGVHAPYGKADVQQVCRGIIWAWKWEARARNEPALSEFQSSAFCMGPGSSLRWMALKCPQSSDTSHTVLGKRACILLSRRLLITKWQSKAPRRQSRTVIGLYARQSLQECWSAPCPRGPCSHSVRRGDRTHGMNGRFMSHCWQHVALRYRGVPSTVSNCCSDDRLIHSLLRCSQLHLDAQVLSHPPLPQYERVADVFVMAGALRASEAGWGQYRADMVAVPTAFSCYSAYYGLLQIRRRCLRKQTPEEEEEEPTERFHLFQVIFLAIKVLWHEQGQNPILQGNI